MHIGSMHNPVYTSYRAVLQTHAFAPFLCRIMQVLSDCLKTEPGCASEADDLGRKAKDILTKAEQQQQDNGGGGGGGAPGQQ
jgi:hypothetical protein